jgi:hypothetical protein
MKYAKPPSLLSRRLTSAASCAKAAETVATKSMNNKKGKTISHLHYPPNYFIA